MIKDDNGEIKYMGTSPDDLELVKTASQQGYKLIETSINSKTVRISGKNYSFEVDYFSVGVCLYFMYYRRYPFGVGKHDVYSIYEDILKKPGIKLIIPSTDE